MTQATNLQTLRQQPGAGEVVAPGFGSLQSFELMQRAARLLSSSTLVPVAYRASIEKTDRYGNITDTRENPNALANSVVALNMAQRMGADPLMVMQNLYIVEGRPSWSSQWIIAAINGCGRFAPLRFDIKSLGEKTVECVTFVWEEVNGRRQRVEKRQAHKIQDKQCIAWTVEKGVQIPAFAPERLKGKSLLDLCHEDGIPVIESPEVTITMAVQEGWYSKNGSKWQTMADVMLRYRSASFFGKLYAPELLMGLQSVEEAQDVIDMSDVMPAQGGGYTVTSDELRQAERPAATASDSRQSPAEDEPPFDVDPSTGEVLQQAEQGGQQQESMFGLEDALSAVRKGDLDTARDIARSLSEKDRQIVEQTITNASQPAGGSRPRRQRDLSDME